MSLFSHAHHFLGNVAVELDLGVVILIFACRAVAALGRYYKHGVVWALPEGLFRSETLGAFWIALGWLAEVCVTDYMAHFAGRPQMVNPSGATHALEDLYEVAPGLILFVCSGALVTCGLGVIFFGVTEAIERKSERARARQQLTQ